MLLVSDGGENASRVRSRELRGLEREAGVAIYAAALTTAVYPPATMEETRGPELLKEIIEYSGGRCWEIDDWHRPGEAGPKIAAEIHEQYIIGYRAPPGTNDGKYRRITVKETREEGMPRLSVSFRGGYYSPAE